MIITRLSPSAYNKFEECPNAFFIDYVLKLRGLVGKAAEKGTAVHAVLEILAEAKLAEQEGRLPCDIEHDSVTINVADIWAIDIESLCKFCYDHYTSIADHLDWKPADLRDVQKWVNLVLDSNYDPRKKTIFATEQYFKLPIQRDWAHYKFTSSVTGEVNEGKFCISGIIDIVYQEDENTLHCLDYKTGSARKDWITGEKKTFDKLMEDPQLRMYHYALKQMYPDIKNFLVSIYYMRVDNKPITLAFSDSEYDKTEEMIMRRFKQIKDTQIPPLNKTWKCKKFCHYGKTSFSKEEHGIEPLTEFRGGQLNKRGETMCMCSQVALSVRKVGMDKTVEEYYQGEDKKKVNENKKENTET
jgi:ATP-dependent helicase/DNAse subunit B